MSKLIFDSCVVLFFLQVLEVSMKKSVLYFPGGTVVKNRLPMQGTRVQSPVREDPTCCRATKPVHHNY